MDATTFSTRQRTRTREGYFDPEVLPGLSKIEDFKEAYKAV